jgi:ABC-type sugar transport system permease subunit
VPGKPGAYVGLHQAGQVLFSNAYGFPASLLTTIVFVALVVPVSLLGGLALAVLAHRKLRGIRVYRTIFSSTVVTGVAVAALVFGTLMNPIVGLLPWLGITTHPPILENPTWALLGVAVVSMWQFLGLSFVIMTAGLQSVPDEILEAASTDGASSWSRFWRITVPLLSPTLFFGVVVGTIFALQSFGQIDILVPYANDPARLHVNVLVYNIVNQVTQTNDAGVAAVMAIALFAITLLLTLLQLRFLERRVTYAR